MIIKFNNVLVSEQMSLPDVSLRNENVDHSHENFISF